MLWLYRFLSFPFRLGPACRFYPPCSVYALQALARFGLLRGAAKALGRLLRCGPWSPGGYDPVSPGRGGDPSGG